MSKQIDPLKNKECYCRFCGVFNGTPSGTRSHLQASQDRYRRASQRGDNYEARNECYAKLLGASHLASPEETSESVERSASERSEETELQRLTRLYPEVARKHEVEERSKSRYTCPDCGSLFSETDLLPHLKEILLASLANYELKLEDVRV